MSAVPDLIAQALPDVHEVLFSPADGRHASPSYIDLHGWPR